MKQYLQILVSVMFVLLAAGCTSGEQTKDKTETGAGETAQVEAPHWSYEGDSGPGHWGELSVKWSPCGDGKKQSPIDIHETMRSDLPDIEARFKPASLKIAHNASIADGINNGHTIQVNFPGGDILTIGDEAYELVQFHFHSPSEHTVAGKHYPMEMHMVHRSEAGRLAVLGVFIEEGEHNPAFDPIWDNLPGAVGSESHYEHVLVDVTTLVPADTTTYRYDGSLTTPPCSEGVKWVIATTPIQLSGEQIGAFRKIIHGNNRPVQPLHGRQVVSDQISEGDL